MAVDEIEILPDDPDEPSGRGRRPPTLLVAAVLVVAALLAVVVISTRDDGDVDVAVDEDDRAPTDLDADRMPAPISLGGPTDGKDSVGLPVEVEPATRLVDGQLVTVTATGFPPGASVGVVMCTKEAGREWGGRGAEACNLGRFASATSSGDGVVVAEFRVQRIMVLDGDEVDCASEADRCLVGVGLISDYDRSGGALVSFDPDAPRPESPTASLAQTEGLADGEEVDLRITGLRPGTSPGYEICDLATQRCGSGGMVLPSADADGVFDAPVRLWRTIGVYGPQSVGGANLDCALEPCELRIYGDTASGGQVPGIELRFAPGGEVRQAPVATLLDEGPFGAGDTIPIEITGVDDRMQVDAMVCNPAGGECWGGGGAASDDGPVRIDLPVPPELRYAGGACEACQIVFTVYPLADPGGLRPPLNPEPLAVAITG